MACPFFMPAEIIVQKGWIHSPRLPLGALYRGICYAGAEPFEPPASALETACNCGYARGRCERFPKDAPKDAPDAVRFSIRSDAGGKLDLIYILERNHAPAKAEPLEYSLTERRFLGEPGRLLAAQARAYIESYLRPAGEDRLSRAQTS